MVLLKRARKQIGKEVIKYSKHGETDWVTGIILSVNDDGEVVLANTFTARYELEGKNIYVDIRDVFSIYAKEDEEKAVKQGVEIKIQAFAFPPNNHIGEVEKLINEYS